jgi:hypothetical protein
MPLTFEGDLPGVPHRRVEVYDLAKGKAVRPLIGFHRDTFLEHLPPEARLALTLGYWNEDEWGPRPDDPEPNGYDPSDGLATLRAVLCYLREHPMAIRRVVEELQEMEPALSAAVEAGGRFPVYFDL